MVPETPNAAFVTMCMDRMLDLEKQVDSLQRSVRHLQQTSCKLALGRDMCTFNDGSGFNFCMNDDTFRVRDRVTMDPLDEAHFNVLVAEHPLSITWDLTPYGHGRFTKSIGASGMPLTVKELMEGIFKIYNAKLPTIPESGISPETRLCDLCPCCAWFGGLTPTHSRGTISSLTVVIRRSAPLPFE